MSDDLNAHWQVAKNKEAEEIQRLHKALRENIFLKTEIIQLQQANTAYQELVNRLEEIIVLQLKSLKAILAGLKNRLEAEFATNFGKTIGFSTLM